jgi:YHS domain-containing protein
MFITSIIATAAIGAAGLQSPTTLSCPITLQPVVKGSKITDWNGVRFTYCCPGCDSQFEKDPRAALEKAAKAGKAVGLFLFDPISKKPIDSAKAKGGFSDYKGVRYFFDSGDEKTAFDKEPSKFGALPTKEALFCPVSKERVETYAKASGYGDFEGVRYYYCCAGCETPFEKEPAKYAPAAKDYVRLPKATTTAPKGGGQ